MAREVYAATRAVTASDYHSNDGELPVAVLCNESPSMHADRGRFL